MYPIKQSTAITVPFFVHDVSGDAVTGLTNGSFTKRISKNGAAFAAMTVTISELENGWYSIPLSTSHSGTVGLLSITFTNAGAKQVNLQFRVSVRIPDDMAFPTTSGRSLDVTATGAAGIDWGNIENKSTANDLSATDIQLVDTTTTNTDMRGTDSANTVVPPSVAQFNARTILSASYFDPAADTVVNVTNVATLTGHTNQTGDSFARIGVAGAGLTDITLNAASIDLVWDEVLTGATHNVTNSSGQRLRQVPTTKFAEGTAQSGGNNSIQLASGDVTANDQFRRAKVLIVKGTGLGQEAIITGSTASTDTLTVTPAWLTNPDVTSVYEIVPGQTHATVQNGGYDNATVYVDTVNGAAGQLSGVNGTSTNPSSNLADAYVIATANNIFKFQIGPGSTVTLPAGSSDRELLGNKYTVLLNSADINNTQISGAKSITGIGNCSTTPATFILCGMGDVTIDPCNGFEVGFFGTFTIRSEGVFVFGGSAALTAPGLGLIIDFGSGLNASQWAMQSWGGGDIEVQNMGAGTGSYSMETSGWGDFTINANCSATSTVDLHGNFVLTNNASGITVTQDANYEEPVLVDAILDEALSGHTTAGSLGKAVTDIETDVTAVLVDTGTTLDTKLNNLSTDIADVPTVSEFNARTLVSASYFDPAADAVANVTLVATTTTNTDMRGTNSALLASNYVDHTSAIADIPTVAEFNARTLVAAGYFDPAADTVANVTLVATTTTNTDMVGTDGANTVVPPSVAQFNARTILSASYFDPAADTVALVATTTDVTNQVTANVTAISGDSAAADSLEASMETLVTGTATGVPTVTTMADSTITETTDDHFIGRVIIWRTGALKQQATVITDYDGGTKLFTFTATTNAASAGDAYVIV